MAGMECTRTEDILSAYLDGDLPEGERKEVAEHLRQCPRCAEEERALRETVSLLRNLPVEKAPPGLLAGVRHRIGEEKGVEPLWKKLFLPAHVKIPLEAAAVVLVFLLVYGIQKQIPATKTAVSPPASVRSETQEAEQPSGPADRQKPATPRTERTDATGRKEDSNTAPAEAMKKSEETVPAGLQEEKVAMVPGKSEAEAALEKERATGFVLRSGGPAALVTSPSPAVSATRVSTEGQAIEPGISRDTAPEEATSPRVLAAPPSRLLPQSPYGREVTIEVARDARTGLEDRISLLTKRLGGKVLRERIRIAGRAGEETLHLMDILRVSIPTDSADVFLEELETFGTIPPEGRPVKADIPAGQVPGTVIYTVRILTR